MTAPQHVPVSPTLRVVDLAKRYGDLWALHRASFTLGRGEIVGLVGPNGSGKTTLLETVAGLLPSDRGRVEFRGNALGIHDRKDVLFYLPDSVRPWPDQRVGWVLQMAEGLFGHTTDRGAWVVARLGLDALIDAPLGTLSKGEHRRVMLAIALITPQPVLLLDEPFDGLDLRQTRDVMAVLREHSAAGRSLLLSIHQLADAGRVADRLVLLSAGAVVVKGPSTSFRPSHNCPAEAWKRCFLRLPDRRAATWLFRKEVRELLASRSYWIFLLVVGLLVGHAFFTAADTYAELSGAGGSSALAHGLSPLDGIVVPVFGAYDIAATFLLPFVVIRLVASEKQNGALKLLLQSPAETGWMLTIKTLALSCAWIVAMIPGAVALLMWRAHGGHLDMGEVAVVATGHFLLAGITIAVAAAAGAIAASSASAAIVALTFTLSTWALDFLR